MRYFNMKKTLLIVLELMLLAMAMSNIQAQSRTTELEEAQMILSEAQAELINAKSGYQLLLETADSTLKDPKEWLTTTYPANQIQNALLTAEQQLKIAGEAVDRERAINLLNRTSKEDIRLIVLKARFKASEARCAVSDSYSQLLIFALQDLYKKNQNMLDENESEEIRVHLDDAKTLRREADVISIAFIEDVVHLKKTISDLDIKNQRYLSSAAKAQTGHQRLENLLTNRSEKTSLTTLLGLTITPVLIGFSALTSFLYIKLRQSKKTIEQYRREREEANRNETEEKKGEAVIQF
jgi:hypothetical protein